MSDRSQLGTIIIVTVIVMIMVGFVLNVVWGVGYDPGPRL